MKKSSQPANYYPIFLNLNGRKCVVVGGGQVALRKVGVLLECGARVRVISPAPCSELTDLARGGEILILAREYRVGDLKGAFVAVAATNDNETNLKVAEEVRENTGLVNVADDADSSDFIVPSYLRRGNVTVAVSTAGRSPALARKIRTMLERSLGDEYAALALLIDGVRTEVKRQGIKVNGDAWQKALDLDLLTDLVRKGNDEKARAILLSNLERQRSNG